jgi:chloride channel protein, CIC family
VEGVISFSDLKEFVFEEGFKDLLLAKDLANYDLVYVTPEESLASSLNKFSFMGMDQLPVIIEQDGSRKIIGIITRSQLLNAYRQEIRVTIC